MKKLCTFAIGLSAVFHLSAQQIVATAPTTEHTNIPTADASVIYDQPRLIKDNGYVSNDGLISNVFADDSFVITADDFILDKNANVTQFSFIGFQLNLGFQNVYRGVLLYIYEDDNGKPAGIPGTQDSYVAKIDLDETSTAHSLTTLTTTSNAFGGYYKISVDVVAANGEAIKLEGNKKYWLAFAPRTNLAGHSHAGNWNWAVGTITGSITQLTDSNNILQRDAVGVWKSFQELVGGYTDYNGTVFSIEGNIDNLGTQELYSNINSLTVAQNENTLYLYTKNEKIKTVEFFSADGRKAGTYNTDTPNITALAKGLYIVKVTTEKGNILSTKFIKK